MNYTLTRQEQETILNAIAADKHAELYTEDPTRMRRMDRLCAARPDVFEMTGETQMGKNYRFPKKCFRITAPRIVSDEQREAARQRLVQARGRKRDVD